jgi:hypothetical protein
MTATPENPDDLLSPEQIAAEIEAAGIALTAGNLQAMIEAARAQDRTEARTVELLPLKPMLPSHVSYEVGRRAAASGELRAQKLGGDWFTTKADVADWLSTSGKWFESESAVEKWHAGIAQLKRWWIP